MGDDLPREGPEYTGTIIPDPADVRDLIYRPTLGLLPERYLCAAMEPQNSGYRKNLTIRSQGSAPTCIGESLAALLDIQRIETYCKNGDLTGAQAHVMPASGAMLYAMALDVESTERGRKATDIYSLRSGLKGFYNTGVCTETTWNNRLLKNMGDTVESASVTAMQEARNVTLGAYYRVRSFINDFHAALVEAGALYVSADLHDGWQTPNAGVIGPAESTVFGGGHAFVIVGYDRRGFLVLNSWGPAWGGYRLGNGPPLPGIALWTYEDWANRVIDAWVLRLAAPTPEAFRFAIGAHGTAMFGADQAPLAAPQPARRLEVLGHYIHLDDGHHVTTGSYPGSRESLKTTLDHLGSEAKRNITDIRLTIHGDIMPTQDVMSRIARSTCEDKAAHVHGLSLIWVNGLLSGSADALKPLFDAALAIAKGNRKDADERIERVARPVGRALWRDAKRAAETAAARVPKDGDAADTLNQIIGLCQRAGKRLHIVSEGAGILLLAELLREGPDADAEARDAALSDVLASMTLVAPLITRQAFEATVGRFLEVWNTRTQRRATMFRADAAFDERLCVGTYSRSWTDLVSRAFEEEPQTTLIGAHAFRGRLRGKPDRPALDVPDQKNGDLSFSSVLQHAAVKIHIAEAIADFQSNHSITETRPRRISR